MKNIDISEELTIPAGYLKLSAIVDDQYFHQVYIGHSNETAKRLFRGYVNSELSKIFVNQES